MNSNDDTNPDRARPTVRIPWGATLLLAPHAVLAVTTGRDRASLRPASAVLRILGARHLLQAGIELRWPTARVLTAAAVVDGIHAATGVAFGLLDHRWRRAALLDAAIAAGFCLATARTARHQPHRPQLRSTR
ncbi:MAG: hypothetical protein J0I49_33110 [Pseudonocardia sp.]|uniref:hypothetical protein n=1 Tax=Pseudonocardia sp. TaxID=60912 RepID=UPI001AC8E423|nr:hypothetical protein [Pseudonocardia sp.]MBN9102898.1 hypothetical protein [Pseudonocardia sp.]